jgi:hypothetical protein
MGVFATRATHRPNGIGQSVVKLDKVEANRLWISGIDLLDGTPILWTSNRMCLTPTSSLTPPTASPAPRHS